MQRLLPLSRGPLRGIQSSPITLSTALFPQYGEESTDHGEVWASSIVTSLGLVSLL